MLESTFLFIGVTALLATGVAIMTPDDGMAIMAGVSGFISWGLLAYGSLDIRVVGDSTTYSFTQPSVTIFAVMMALVPAYVALTGPIEIVSRAKEPRQQDL